MKRLFLIAALALGGCASQPEQLILAPTEPFPTLRADHQVGIDLTSQDHRTETFLVRIQREDQPAQLVSAGSNPRALLESGLRQGLQGQGYDLDRLGEVRLNLTLEQLLVDVEQGSLNHTATSYAIASVVVDKDGRQLVKRYQARGTLKGVMRVDMARLEREVNDRLNQLLNSMLNDPELHQFIQ
ncbi:YajG family lipoprotein [Ferrimonas balearica]|uniref:YajG family lipoprotein n=1 Tax=Ferrimonas balearica TaxID=44012 RepID=UPI001C98F0A2|nr:YajG family lipoprotein [Ferrimonas balearica]MBY5990591.1 YajG family lipoprotein [Ferrimonas balearica]